MDKTIMVSLNGHAEQFGLDEDAYARLERYLARANARLEADPDRAEVLRDLERSIGDRLATLQASDVRLVRVADIDGVLEDVGSVDTGSDPAPDEAEPMPRRRRLYRIREGQQIAGVCTGLAAYSEIRVDWVRTIFVVGTLGTAGILGLVYLALAFILP